MDGVDRVKHLLQRIYGENTGALAFQRIIPLIERFPNRRSRKEKYFSQEDVVLITYCACISSRFSQPRPGPERPCSETISGMEGIWERES